ncbi:unnamed protein product [Rotaria sp. Silwood2]|nr:unnamed protein product [Rotaria sp. Silwood2]CAF3288433.1 unnamed protein product [Rotaria sp. Silwood2]CAF4309186.1 unnamed protein product [Rotaria sp. Silwood2]CAF4399135.1 unnamed protein product [Rotaria sp. Silwood2]
MNHNYLELEKDRNEINEENTCKSECCNLIIGSERASRMVQMLTKEQLDSLEQYEMKSIAIDLNVPNYYAQIRDLYIHISNLCYFSEFNASTPLKLVYTSVHGIGQSYAEQAFVAFTFQLFISSNLEEGNETPECAIAIANKNNADFIIPTDSDADRFALIERDITGSAQTGWRILTGNLLGALLGNLPFYLNADENQRKDSKDEEYIRPKTCANSHITDVRDLTIEIAADFVSQGKDKKLILPCSASTQMITFYFDNGCEITIRVSGKRNNS